MNLIKLLHKQKSLLTIRSCKFISKRTITKKSGPFPSITITRDNITPKGPFAEAQANFLNPDKDIVQEIDDLLNGQKTAIVAHFYMDPELQGVLSSLKWPHVLIADSLLMSEKAVKMAENGMKNIVVLGVDFMAESVRSTLDFAGFEDVNVYRTSLKKIGCSLADAAEKITYEAYLRAASKKENTLHVVYINTSIRSKAVAQSILPTITCTSSNVVRTILTASATIPELNIVYGPDTYMGENLERIFKYYTTLSNSDISKLHPSHNKESMNQLVNSFDYFKQGNCIVHHMFGSDVVKRIKNDYPCAFYTAHLEVPGEMFVLAMEAQKHNRGVVGSTSNILDFIKIKTKEVIERNPGSLISFVLGTETGMVTSVVRGIQQLLRDAPSSDNTKVEIVFPVSEEAISQTNENDIKIVPGVSQGEGCSISGGCATCPYMKMNTLEGLQSIIKLIKRNDTESLRSYGSQKYIGKLDGIDIHIIGRKPIEHMKHFMSANNLPLELVRDVMSNRKPALYTSKLSA